MSPDQALGAASGGGFGTIDPGLLRASRSSMTSARFLLSWSENMYARGVWSKELDGGLQAAAVMKDLYIKARSYAILNKAAFIPSLLLLITCVGWPVVEAMVGEAKGFPRSASSAVQALITGVTGMLIYVYMSYKKKQSEVEAAMRHVLFGEGRLTDRVRRAINVVAVLDTGLQFRGFDMPAAGSTPVVVKDSGNASSSAAAHEPRS